MNGRRINLGDAPIPGKPINPGWETLRNRVLLSGRKDACDIAATSSVHR
jgi:hypothetical protein